LSNLSALFLGLFCLSAALGLSWALGKLGAPIGQRSDPVKAGIDALMAGSVAAYTYPPKRADDVTTPPDETGQPDVDIRIQLARQETKVEGLTQTVEREFARMAEALGKHADAVNNAFAAMKNDFVTKSDFKALEDKYADLKKIVWGACGLILTSVFVAIVATVLVKP